MCSLYVKKLDGTFWVLIELIQHLSSEENHVDLKNKSRIQVHLSHQLVFQN